MGLFSTHTIERTTEIKPVVQTIHEHKAPTDESVRLLNEMEDKARKNLIRQFIVKDNVVNAVISEFDDTSRHIRTLNFRFTVNGEEYMFDVDRERHEAMWSTDEIMDHLIREIAQTLTLKFTERFLLEKVIRTV